MPLTRPIDNKQNADLYRRQRDKMHATVETEHTPIKVKQSMMSAERDGTDTTGAMTADRPDLTSTTSRYNSKLSSSIGKGFGNKTNYLNRGCPKLVSLANQRKNQDVLSNMTSGLGKPHAHAPHTSVKEKTRNTQRFNQTVPRFRLQTKATTLGADELPAAMSPLSIVSTGDRKRREFESLMLPMDKA